MSFSPTSGDDIKYHDAKYISSTPANYAQEPPPRRKRRELPDFPAKEDTGYVPPPRFSQNSSSVPLILGLFLISAISYYIFVQITNEHYQQKRSTKPTKIIVPVNNFILTDEAKKYATYQAKVATVRWVKSQHYTVTQAKIRSHYRQEYAKLIEQIMNMARTYQALSDEWHNSIK